MIRIAVFNVGRKCFGNTILQIPFFVGLKKKYPGCHITLFTSQETSQVLLFDNCIDEIVSDRKLSLFNITSKLRKGKFDFVFNLRRTSGRIHLSCLFSGIKVRYAYTTSSVYNLIYRYNKVIEKGTSYPALAYMSLLNSVLKSDYDTDIIKDIGSREAQLKSLTLLPGGSSAQKKWPIEKYLNATTQLLADSSISQNIKNVDIVLGPQEYDYLDKIPQMIGMTPVHIHKQPSVKQLIELASQSVLALSNDCGPGHIFQMSKVPMVVLFGWIDGVSPYHVIQEWFLSHNDSCAVTPDVALKRVDTIPVEKVVGIAKVMANTDHANHTDKQSQ